MTDLSKRASAPKPRRRNDKAEQLYRDLRNIIRGLESELPKLAEIVDRHEQGRLDDIAKAARKPTDQLTPIFQAIANLEQLIDHNGRQHLYLLQTIIAQLAALLPPSSRTNP